VELYLFLSYIPLWFVWGEFNFYFGTVFISTQIGKIWMVNLLAPELFFLILALPVYKMRIIQEPNTLDL